MKLAGWGLALVGALALGYLLFGSALQEARAADACAEALLSAQAQHQHLEALVPSESVRDRIASAQRFELVYVRPSPDGTKVGYAIAQSSTASKADVLRLNLDLGERGCRFLQDEEGGVFSRSPE